MPQRLALLIANSEYQDAQLKRLRTPTADAERLAQVLADPVIGNFEVLPPLINRPLQEVREAIERLYQRKTRDDLLLLYYSGHGIRPEYGEFFLAVQNTKRDVLAATALEGAFVTKLMDRSNSQRKVVLLDCCHSGAFGEGAKSLGDKAGTDEIFAGNGTGRVILTASSALEYAWEGDRLVGETELSIFTRCLVEGMETGAADTDGDGDVNLDELYAYVYDRVIAEAEGRQSPMKKVLVEGKIIIARNPLAWLPEVGLPVALKGDIQSPADHQRLSAVKVLARYLRSRDSVSAEEAREALEDLRDDGNIKVATAAASALADWAAKVEVASPHSRTRTTARGILTLPRSRTAPHALRIAEPIEMALVSVPGGEFRMGSTPSRDAQAGKHEQPPHLVYVSEFLISIYPVTHAQYVSFVRDAGYRTRGNWVLLRPGKDNHPVTDVCWEDAFAFCEWLSAASGLAVRLPSEAEWEKAARGIDGRTYPWSDDWDSRKANVKGTGPGGTTPVGHYSPEGDSPYGAADMVGNVWEWCNDWWDENLYKGRINHVVRDPCGPESGQYRVLRGGSWYNEATDARCACRVRNYPNYSSDSRGFRVVCTPPPKDLSGR